MILKDLSELRLKSTELFSYPSLYLLTEMTHFSRCHKEKDAFHKREGSLIALLGMLGMNALCIAGDDLVITDAKVVSEYLKIMEECEVRISKEKPLISSVGPMPTSKSLPLENNQCPPSPKMRISPFEAPIFFEAGRERPPPLLP